jgi:hypothetical protein
MFVTEKRGEFGFWLRMVRKFGRSLKLELWNWQVKWIREFKKNKFSGIWKHFFGGFEPEQIVIFGISSIFVLMRLSIHCLKMFIIKFRFKPASDLQNFHDCILKT